MRLGQLLAAAGVSTIVVMNTSAPELAGVQNVPPAPRRPSWSGAQTIRSTCPRAPDALGRGLRELAVPRHRRPATPGSGADARVLGEPNTGTAHGRGRRRRPGPGERVPLDVNGQPAPRATVNIVGRRLPGRRRRRTPDGQDRRRPLPLNGVLALFMLACGDRLAGLRVGASTRVALHRPAPATRVRSGATMPRLRRPPAAGDPGAGRHRHRDLGAAPEESRRRCRAGSRCRSNAESSALYCTGLTTPRGARRARHVLQHRPGAAHRHRRARLGHRARPGAAPRLLHPEPSLRSRTSSSTGQTVSFGVSALVNGGGVVADEVTATTRRHCPCSGAGVTSWYASGLDTPVGSSAVLSFYNPTATPAVINVTIDTPSGFVDAAPFQGLPVAAPRPGRTEPGRQIVNTRNVGVHVEGPARRARDRRRGGLRGVDRLRHGETARRATRGCPR